MFPLYEQIQRIEQRAGMARWINWYMGTHLTPDEIDQRIPSDTQDILVALALELDKTRGHAP